MPDPSSTPTLVSLIICDQVIDDRLTNKKSAIGLFNTILVGELPARTPQIMVLASLTEIGGPTPIALRLMRDADNLELFSTEGDVDAETPLATVDLVFSLQGITFPATGQYAFELWAGSELLGRRRFQIVRHAKARDTESTGSD